MKVELVVWCLDVAVARCLGLFVSLRMCLVVLLRPDPCLCPVTPDSLPFCLAHGVQGGRVVAGVPWCSSWWPTWVFVFDTPGKYVQYAAVTAGGTSGVVTSALAITGGCIQLPLWVLYESI